ncbi:tetratricopeptide repeat protein [Acidisarcina polymorpha]|nr:multiheme c-type cytochrome [Acidisarcina polymorpha]
MLSLPVSVALSASHWATSSQARRPASGHPAAQTKSGVSPEKIPVYRNTSADVRYVGSAACKSCHRSEYEHYLQTPHGQAATLPEGRPELRNLPAAGDTICPDGGVHCFRVFPDKGGYFMSQFDRGANGTELHVEVEKIAFALGKPLMATGYLIQRGSYLFEAPLTFYSAPGPEHTNGWALSPGYDKDSLGFTRPVVDSCITCHVGRPRPTDAASNLYKSPPFEELSIGCESCHGPGGLHVEERQERRSGPAAIDTSIVNPRHLTTQLADETCMYCHELGEARVPQPGKSFQDYRPGVPLLRTEAIFKSKLLFGWNLEEWSDEMAASACYRFSKGAMRCSTCHDAHFTPSAQEAPSFYRAKCLTCHQSSSCTLPFSERQHTQPVDNCITCHMPKHVAPKLVKVGGEGTSHRITKTEDEPIPQVDAPQTSPSAASGMILIDSDGADAQKRLSPIVLLKAYQGVLAHDDKNDLAERYESLLQTMSSDKDDASVFSALASSELAKHTDEGNRMAIHDLSEAIRLHSDSPRDYMLLSELDYRASDLNSAITTLTTALAQFPYVPTPYENLAVCYLRSGQSSKASEIIHRGLEIFPSDRNLLLLDQRIHP